MKTAMITGASRGIGQAIAYEFAKNGYNLVLTCVNNIEMLNGFASRLSSDFDVSVKTFKCNNGDFESVKQSFEGLDSLDVLINNAGISYVGLLSEMSVEDWRRTMSVNLDSVFYTCKLAIPLMLKEHEGNIINVSSVWGNVGASMEVAYSASKGGVNAFTKALSKELAPSNIPVNAIACGFVDTEMNSHLSYSEREEVRNEIPADRFTSPEEVAKAVYNLSLMPPYITGQIVTMDGGWT